MNSLLGFSALAALLTAGTWLALVLPLRRGGDTSRGAGGNEGGGNEGGGKAGRSAVIDAPSDGVASDAALGLLREQLRQLDEAHAHGHIRTDDWQQERSALARRAVAEASTHDGAHHADTHATRHPGAAAAWPPVPKSLTVGMGIAMLVLATAGYLMHGRPDATALSTGPWGSDTPSASITQVEAMVLDMARELDARERAGQSGAEDASAWEMLARALASLQRFDEADRAYQRAIERSLDRSDAPARDTARMLADRADVLRAAEGDSASDQPRRLIERALKLDPLQPKALALAGRIAYEQRDHASAIGYWRRAQGVAPAGSDLAIGLERGIAQAQAALQQAGTSVAPPSSPSSSRPLLGAPRPAPAAAATTAPHAAAAGASPSASAAPVVSGQVEIAPALRSQVRPSDVVFIVARASASAMPAGTAAPRMPVAIVQLRVADLPARFTLDDAQAMSPDLRPSQFSELSITARVARSGQALPSAGDWVSDAIVVRRGHSATLQIARVVP